MEDVVHHREGGPVLGQDGAYLVLTQAGLRAQEVREAKRRTAAPGKSPPLPIRRTRAPRAAELAQDGAGRKLAQ